MDDPRQEDRERPATVASVSIAELRQILERARAGPRPQEPQNGR
jgi:hypothetical protein